MIIMIINIDSLLCIMINRCTESRTKIVMQIFPLFDAQFIGFSCVSTLGYCGLFHSPSGSNRHHQTGKQIEGCLVEPFANFDSHRIYGDRYFENGFWFGSCNQVCG
uniref:Uncharacterized protein n=1 Tax=Cacopsylla melanoneura TaxID=428564 RepID=A0A8D8YTZ3_9HEMI